MVIKEVSNNYIRKKCNKITLLISKKENQLFLIMLQYLKIQNKEENKWR